VSCATAAAPSIHTFSRPQRYERWLAAAIGTLWEGFATCENG
jgi:hypothetical protein